MTMSSKVKIILTKSIYTKSIKILEMKHIISKIFKSHERASVKHLSKKLRSGNLKVRR